HERKQIVGLEVEQARVVAHETARERASRELSEILVLERLHLPWRELQLLRNLIERKTGRLSRGPEPRTGPVRGRRRWLQRHVDARLHRAHWTPTTAALIRRSPSRAPASPVRSGTGSSFARHRRARPDDHRACVRRTCPDAALRVAGWSSASRLSSTRAPRRSDEPCRRFARARGSPTDYPAAPRARAGNSSPR